jgi:D-alanine-D-alanine ligase
MMQKVLLVMGSRTSEDSYGRRSGSRVAEALRRVGWQVETLHASDGAGLMQKLLGGAFDLVVPVGFGPPCEDGHVFAAARLAGIPCAGPTPAAGSLMQDKALLSSLVAGLFPAGSGVRAPRGVALTNRLTRSEAQLLIEHLRLPLVVKPAFGGSSEGLVVASNHDEALSAALAAVRVEGKMLVQELEREVRTEVSCTVLDDPNGPLFLPIVELRRNDVVVLGTAEKFGTGARGRHRIPPRLSTELVGRLERSVLRLHEEVGTAGLTRADVLVLEDDELVILELNGIPGLLESSIACDAAAAAGIPFDELCRRYAESAFLTRPEPDVWHLPSMACC